MSAPNPIACENPISIIGLIISVVSIIIDLVIFYYSKPRARILIVCILILAISVIIPFLFCSPQWIIVTSIASICLCLTTVIIWGENPSQVDDLGGKHSRTPIKTIASLSLVIILLFGNIIQLILLKSVDLHSFFYPSTPLLDSEQPIAILTLENRNEVPTHQPKITPMGEEDNAVAGTPEPITSTAVMTPSLTTSRNPTFGLNDDCITSEWLIYPLDEQWKYEPDVNGCMPYQNQDLGLLGKRQGIDIDINKEIDMDGPTGIYRRLPSEAPYEVQFRIRLRNLVLYSDKEGIEFYAGFIQPDHESSTLIGEYFTIIHSPSNSLPFMQLGEKELFKQLLATEEYQDEIQVNCRKDERSKLTCQLACYSEGAETRTAEISTRLAPEFQYLFFGYEVPAESTLSLMIDDLYISEE